jgi:hypothetical protein
MMAADWITVVSGLPRSGTSMMMQMVAAGGMPVLTDGVRPADPDNPLGYFELEAVKRTRSDAGWVPQARGKAVKVVHLLLRDLPPEFPYRVILMRRDMDEVLESQRAMLDRLGRPGASLPPARLSAIYAAQLANVLQWAASQPDCRLLEVAHRDCVSDPQTTARQVNAFLDGSLEAEAMAAAVDSALWRRKH